MVILVLQIALLNDFSEIFLKINSFTLRNAETVQYFWANWNIPVHKWALRYGTCNYYTFYTYDCGHPVSLSLFTSLIAFHIFHKDKS